MPFFRIDSLFHFAFSFVFALFDPGLAAALGLAKEIIDPFIGGVGEFRDLVADALGILFATRIF